MTKTQMGGGSHVTPDEAPGTNLRVIRQRAGMTQQAVAFASGLSMSTIARVERGEQPTTTVARRLCVALGCTFDELLGSPAGEAA